MLVIDEHRVWRVMAKLVSKPDFEDGGHRPAEAAAPRLGAAASEELERAAPLD
jgi:hypothetical protein